MDTSLAISSFGVDEQQELYALAFNGRIYLVHGATMSGTGNEGGSIRFYSPNNLDASAQCGGRQGRDSRYLDPP